MQLLRSPGGIQAPSWREGLPTLGRAVWTRSQSVPPAWMSHTGSTSGTLPPSDNHCELSSGSFSFPLHFWAFPWCISSLRTALACVMHCLAHHLGLKAPMKLCPHHMVGLLHSVPDIAKKASTMISNTLRCQEPEQGTGPSLDKENKYCFPATNNDWNI